MSGEALGLIETIGLAAAVTAADTCLKSANVSLVGYELTKGFGLVTVKILGDVSAVTAAINSAKVSASKVGTVYSTLIIPKPSKDADTLICTKETVGVDNKVKELEINDKEIIADSKEVQIENSQINEENNFEETDIKKTDNEETEIKVTEDQDADIKVTENQGTAYEEIELKDNDTELCNLCGDPKCPRKKGMPRKLCIHYK